MSEITFAVAQRANGAWGVTRSDAETVFGSYYTRAEAQACADGATWALERLAAAGQAEAAR